MYSNHSILGIIPARGGSKGLPQKNIKEIGGKPLIAWTISKANKSQYLDDVVVSTDCSEISDVAVAANGNVPYLRPDHLASDTASSVDVVLHVLDEQEKRFGKVYDYIVLLEPTSPLREDDDIDNMIKKLIDSKENNDSICSIGEVGAHPVITKKIQGDNVVPYFSSDEISATRRQDLQRAFFPYGVAYMVSVEAFKREKTFYTSKNTYYEIKRYQCYEIDDIYDFIVTERIMEYEWNLSMK